MKTNGPSTGGTLMGVASRAGGRRRVLRLVVPLALDLGLLGRNLADPDELGATVVEQGDALLDALEGLRDVTLEALEDTDRVLVGAGPDPLGVVVGLADDAAALELGRLGQAALVDEERRLLLGARDDALRLFLGLLDDPFAFGVDPLRRADLFGDRDAQLVDEAKGRVLIDDDVGRERQLLAVRDQRFETLDEEDDVDGSALLLGGLWHARLGLNRGRVPRAAPPPPAVGAWPRRHHRTSRSPSRDSSSRSRARGPS